MSIWCELFVHLQPLVKYRDSYSEQKRKKKSRLMRMNIREMPSQLENIKSLLWPYGNRYVSGYQLFLPGLPVVDQTPKKPGSGKRGL